MRTQSVCFAVAASLVALVAGSFQAIEAGPASSGLDNTNPLFHAVQVVSAPAVAPPMTNNAGISQNITQAAELPPHPLVNTPTVLSVEDGAVVAQTAHYTARFAPDLFVAGAVQLSRDSQAPLRSSIVALAYYEGDHIVVIGQVQSAAAQIVAPDHVLYANAFKGGVSADVVYHCAADGSFEQDVVLHKALPAPSLYGLTNAEFAVITEFYDSPQPAVRLDSLDLSQWNQRLGTDVKPLQDETLGFPRLRMRMVRGKAFSLQDSDETIPVRKQWRVIDGRRFLIERTPYQLIAPLEQGLPNQGASLDLKKWPAVQNLPSLQDAATTTPPAGFAQNAVLPAQGVVMDYILVSSPILNVDFTDANHTKTGMAAIGQSSSDFWNRSITTDNSGTVTFNNLWWSDSSASAIDLTVQNAPGVWGNGVTNDPMYNAYVYSWNAQSVFVTLTNIPANVYDLYVYGHSPGDTGNGLFKLRKNGVEIGYRGTTVWGHLWASTNWTEGEQYVVFRDISVGPGDTLQLEVLPVNSYPILAGLQLAPSGAVGETVQPIQRLINVDTCGTQGAKVGPAAVGQSANDVWNLYQQPWATYGVLTNLSYADGTPSAVGLIVQNAPGYWGFDSPPAPIDPMYDGYIYPQNGGNITVSLTNLADGVYDFYVYAHACSDTGNSVVNLTCGGTDYGTRGTTIWGSGWASANWEEGQQYVAFRDVLVTATNPVQITVSPYQQYYTFLNGLQIVQHPLDSDGDGLSDWAELTTYGSDPLNPHTFNPVKTDAEYLFTASRAI